MAQVQDALCMSWNANLLERDTGPGQVGGELDAVSLVAAIVLLCQARHHQGLSTLLSTLDLKQDFDLANIDGMWAGCHAAGITGRDWLLIDDILRSDRQVLELHGILTAVFTLARGTAQGRKFSLHVFNGLLRSLADELEAAFPSGTNAILPPFAFEALCSAARQSCPTSIRAPPSAQPAVLRLVEELSNLPQDVVLKHAIARFFRPTQPRGPSGRIGKAW